jgi:hypothetical protein
MSRSAAQTSNLARVEHRRISGLTGKREVLHPESLEFRRLLSAAAIDSTLLDGYEQTPLSFQRNQGQIDGRAFDGDDDCSSTLMPI